MKTAEKPMIQELLKILNPVRVMKVEDWMKIAKLVQQINPDPRCGEEMETIQWFRILQSRYEALTSQPLKKEMFVCEVEKPMRDKLKHWDYKSEDDIKKIEHEYTKAQEKVLFEGFEFSTQCYYESGGKWYLINPPIEISLRDTMFIIQVSAHRSINLGSSPTVYDLIIEIDRYNRTATTPITINFTENFLKELLK